MKIFVRHKLSTVLLVIYTLWWVFVLTWFNSDKAAYPHSCGAANGGLIVLSLFISLLYSLGLLFLIILNKGQKRNDYLKFLGFVLLPAILIFGLIAFIMLIY